MPEVNDPVARLGEHLWDLKEDHQHKVSRVGQQMAIGILADTQSHIDALVEAGVLEKVSDMAKCTGPMQWVPVYTVVTSKPHEHDWVWYEVAETSGTLAVSCLSCGEGLPAAVSLMSGRAYTGPTQ